MAVAQETLDQLRSAGLADVDPEIADLLGRELERQRNQIELIASENFTWPSVLEAVGSVPTNKYAEGYPGRRYYGGCEVVDEIEQLAIDRAKDLFGAEHANVQPHAGAQANMAAYFALLQPGDTILGAAARPRRPPDARAQGQLLGPALHDRLLRRLARDERRRLRRGARDREGAPAEADRLRRLGVPAHRRHGRVPQDRGRGRRAADVRHGPLLRARRRRPAPEPGRALRHRHLDDAQDARRPAVGLRPLPRGARAGGRQGGLPGHAGRPARARDRRQGGVLPDRRVRCVPLLPGAGAGERRRALRGADDRRDRRPHRRHRHAPAPARPARDRVDRQGRRGAAARGEADREPQHGPVRRAAADGRVRRPDRHARRDDARLRRGGLPRGGADHRRCARRRGARRARRPRPRRCAPSGRSTRASAGTRPTHEPAASPRSRTRWSSTSSRTCATRRRRPSTSASSSTS